MVFIKYMIVETTYSLNKDSKKIEKILKLRY